MKVTLIPGRQGKDNVGQSNCMPTAMCALSTSVSLMGQVRVILTQLEPLVLPGMAVKKSRILWNEEKVKRFMELYEWSNRDASRGCARRLLEAWTLTYPEYSTTSNALMKRVRLIKSRPAMAQTSNSDSQAAAEVEETDLCLTLLYCGETLKPERVVPTSQLLQWGLRDQKSHPRVSQRRNLWIPAQIWIS